MPGTKVLLETNLGNITLELEDQTAPLTVANFLRYVDEKHYNGTIFHRVIPGFMKNEAANGLSNKTGTIAMARTGVVDSATAQFFINTVDNDFLDHRDNTPAGFGYCVFGRVIDGMDTVRKIEASDTTSHGPYDDVPVDTVTILKASRID